MNNRTIRIFAAMASVAWLALCTFQIAFGDDAKKKNASARQGLKNQFFAFDNGVGRGSWKPEQQAKVLKEYGYAGMGYTGTKNIPELLNAFDAQGLKVFSIYFKINVEHKNPPYDPSLKTAIKQLKGRDTLIALNIIGGKASTEKYDDHIVPVLREIADLAQESGLRVGIYPHADNYVAKVGDAIRLAKKIDRKNVGIYFNLSHFLLTDDHAKLEERLTEAMPYMVCASINGADPTKKDAQSIKRLDSGTYDVAKVLKIMKRLGYTGPIGLQCYFVPGDQKKNLRIAMDAWKKLSAEAAEE